MRITIEGKAYDFREDSADNVELMAIEKVTGMTTTEWADALSRGSVLCITALIWILRRRTEPNLTFDDIVFNPTSIAIEDDGPKELAD